LGLTLILYFTALGARDFWAPVEPRYAEITRVMFAKGEWIVPTINGEIYTDKPILYFWLVLIASKIAGVVNEWTVRLPVAVAGIGLVWTTYFVGRDFYGPRVGLIAASVLATSMRVIWEARWAHIDIVFCLFFLLTIYFGARLILKKGASNEILLAYLFMGLATLAKGLIGVVLPVLLFAAFVILRRDWRIIVDAKLTLGIVIFLLVVAPWLYLINSATDGQWLSDFIFVHHLQRYTHGIGHRQPFYYYFTTLPVDFLPWTVFAIPAAVAYFPYPQLNERPVSMFFFLCFAVIFLFFSASDTKRDLYLLPLLPSLALLVGNYINDLARAQLNASTLFQWLTESFFALIAFSGLVLPLIAWILRRDAFWISLPIAVVMAAGGILAAIFVGRGRPMEAVAACSLLITAATISAALWVFPYLEAFKSRRPFSLLVKNTVAPTAPLYIYADTINDFNFYTEREVIPVLFSRQEVADVLRQSSQGYMLIKGRDFNGLALFDAENIIAENRVGSTSWKLIILKKSGSGNRAGNTN
jgi:4-amino-4-deoxy-L-arabinose transferase-like glycosyltransferase